MHADWWERSRKGLVGTKQKMSLHRYFPPSVGTARPTSHKMIPSQHAKGLAPQSDNDDVEDDDVQITSKEACDKCFQCTSQADDLGNCIYLCLLCKNNYKQNTKAGVSNLMKHLKSSHGDEYVQFALMSDDERAKGPKMQMRMVTEKV